MGNFNLPTSTEPRWVSLSFFPVAKSSRCSTTTWRVKVLHVKDLQWFVTKTLAAKRDKMWMWWGASAEKSVFKQTPRQKGIGGEITGMCFFKSYFKRVLFSRWCWDFVGILLWKTVDGQNPRKSMDMANIWYSQCFIHLIWSTGFCPQLVAASLEKWFSTWRIIPFYKCLIDMVSKFTNGGY